MVPRGVSELVILASQPSFLPPSHSHPQPRMHCVLKCLNFQIQCCLVVKAHTNTAKLPPNHTRQPRMYYVQKCFNFQIKFVMQELLSFYVKHESILSYFHSNWNVLTWGKLSQPELSFSVFTLGTIYLRHRQFFTNF